MTVARTAMAGTLRFLVLGVLLPAASALLAASTPADAGDMTGYINAGVGVRTGEGDVVYLRSLVNGKFTHQATKKLSFRLETDVYYDHPYFRPDGRFNARVREGYAKLRFKNADLKVGRVQVTWGDIDGFIVADQVSPFDLEHFIIPPFDEIRLGVDGVFLDYYFNWSYSMQLMWIARFNRPDLPPSDSPFDLFRINNIDNALPGGLRIENGPRRLPAQTFENSEAGVRFTGTTRAADWQVGYLYSWDDIPYFQFAPNATKPGVIDAFQAHGRYHLFMGNIVFPLGPTLIRLETAYNKDRFRNVVIPTDPSEPFDLAVRQDQWVTAGVVDFKPTFDWWQNADASFQVIYDRMIDPAPGLARVDEAVYVGARLSAAYRNDTIKPRLFAIANTRGADTWVQAVIDWEPFDQWRFSLEYDLFDGHEYRGFLPGFNNAGGIYGQFDKNDLVVVSTRYSF